MSNGEAAPTVPVVEDPVVLRQNLVEAEEVLRKKGVSPEDAFEAYSEFRRLQKTLNPLVTRYNQLAQRLALANGTDFQENQMMKFPQNMRIENHDLRRYFKLRHLVDGTPETVDGDSAELPVELL